MKENIKELKILNLTNDLPLPSKGSDYASGFDIYAAIENDITIPSSKFVTIPCGIKLVIPKDYEVQIRPRSGLAAKHGLTVLNSPGTIDEDYRGEIKVILINHGEDDYIVKRGDRIAQMVVNKVDRMPIRNITAFEFNAHDSTGRGNDGFGSSGYGLKDQ